MGEHKTLRTQANPTKTGRQDISSIDGRTFLGLTLLCVGFPQPTEGGVQAVAPSMPDPHTSC